MKPENPSSGANTPVIMNIAIISKDVVSIEKESLTKRKIPIAIIPNVMYSSI
jgi:hypothetical protein